MRGRKPARIALLGVLAVLCLAGGFSREMLLSFYQIRLSYSPGFIVESLRAGVDSPKRIALSRFARTPPGQAALLDCLLAVLGEAFKAQAFRDELPRSESAVIGYEDRKVWMSRRARGKMDGHLHSSTGELELACVPVLLDLLGRTGGAVLESPAYPGVRFTFLGPEWAYKVCEAMVLPSAWSRGPVCLAREKARESVAELVRGLSHEDSLVRLQGVLDLLSLGQEAGEAIPELVIALGDHDFSVKKAAARALGMLGRLAIPALIECLSKPEYRFLAAEALGKMEEHAEHIVPDLITALDQQDSLTRAVAAMALGKMGKSAQAALPGLRKALDQPDQFLQKCARESIERIGAPPDR